MRNPWEEGHIGAWIMTREKSYPGDWRVIRTSDGHVEHCGDFRECNALIVRLEFESQHGPEERPSWDQIQRS